MKRIPEPDQTPQGPAYQGRLLDRPDDEVVDQGASFDLRTLVTRRGALTIFGLGAGGFALAACGSDTSETSPGTNTTASNTTASNTTDGEIPQETNGPYPADGTADLNILQQSGIVRSDITTSLGGGEAVAGVPLEFSFNLTDMVNASAFAGAAVYVWHCDAQGRYSMYSEGVEDETFLRGIQVADDDGRVTFTTIVPGCYAGRWTHIHFEVYPDLDSATSVGNAIATSQVAFGADMLTGIYQLATYPDSAANLAGVGTQPSDDSLFGEGDWTLQVPTMSGSIQAGYAGSLDVAIDTSTTPSQGGMPAGGAPGGGAPGGGAPGGQGAPPSN